MAKRKVKEIQKIEIVKPQPVVEGLVVHPKLPTWPTPAALVLSIEQERLQKMAKDGGFSPKNWAPLTDVIHKIDEEHARWREAVVKAGNHDHTESSWARDSEGPGIHVPYGSPVAKPRPNWHLAVAFFLGAAATGLLFFILLKT